MEQCLALCSAYWAGFYSGQCVTVGACPCVLKYNNAPVSLADCLNPCVCVVRDKWLFGQHVDCMCTCLQLLVHVSFRPLGIESVYSMQYSHNVSLVWIYVLDKISSPRTFYSTIAHDFANIIRVYISLFLSMTNNYKNSLLRLLGFLFKVSHMLWPSLMAHASESDGRISHCLYVSSVCPQGSAPTRLAFF